MFEYHMCCVVSRRISASSERWSEQNCVLGSRPGPISSASGISNTDTVDRSAEWKM